MNTNFFRLMITVIVVNLLVFATVHAENKFVNTTVVEGEYEELLSAVKDVIKGKGINIAHTLPAGDMLGRTGPSFNIKEKVFLNAETIEFCSAKISHKLAIANAENIILCPFTISVYVLSSDPKNVRLSTRVPFAVDDASKEAVAEMNKLVANIISEAADW